MVIRIYLQASDGLVRLHPRWWRPNQPNSERASLIAIIDFEAGFLAPSVILVHDVMHNAGSSSSSNSKAGAKPSIITAVRRPPRRHQLLHTRTVNPSDAKASPVSPISPAGRWERRNGRHRGQRDWAKSAVYTEPNADALSTPRRRYHFMIAFFIYDYA